MSEALRMTPATVRRVPHEAYAVCPPGIEAICAAELSGLGVRAVKAERGGVSFRATTRQLYAANLWLRSATRVVVRIASFEASSFAELERQAADVVLDPWLGDRPPALRVSAHRAALYHTDAIAERLHGVWGGPGDAESPAENQLLVVRNVGNRFTVSMDCSGEPLYKRGWRQEVAKAPLRENLAAAMLLATGWQADQPLLDPFCGSGTLVIEAALLAANRPPGFQRSFAFFDWPAFEAGTWASVVGAAVELERPHLPLSLVGADRDAGAVAAAQANAERAEVPGLVEFVERPVSATPAPLKDRPAGWVVTNPPYGSRVAHGTDLRNLYARLGEVVRDKLTDWSVALLVADRRLAAHSGLSLHEQLRFSNGGIDVELLVGTAKAPGRGRGHSRAQGAVKAAGEPSR